MRAIAPKKMREIRDALRDAATVARSHTDGWDPTRYDRLAEVVDRALKPGLKAKAFRSARAAEKKSRAQLKREETSNIYKLVAIRAHDNCECGCGRTLVLGSELDHFFGRGKAKQSVANCWFLHPDCHREKTDNMPSAGFWLRAFIAHASRQGYLAERWKAESRLAFVLTRSGQ